ncbi:MAG: hypothetical protein J6R47_06575 [Acholeplasmatales bacterium]|nr:hypothetical protein [Acholeplasmatales bacterium]
MINLKNEIEKLRDSVKEKIEKLKDNIQDVYLKGGTDALNQVLKMLDQYNIITAPKSIKLSEILHKINYPSLNIERVKKRIDVYSGKLILFSIHVKKLHIKNVPLDGDTEWLYILSITNTLIEDDME